MEAFQGRQGPHPAPAGLQGFPPRNGKVRASKSVTIRQELQSHRSKRSDKPRTKEESEAMLRKGVNAEGDTLPQGRTLANRYRRNLG